MVRLNDLVTLLDREVEQLSAENNHGLAVLVGLCAEKLRSMGDRMRNAGLDPDQETK